MVIIHHATTFRFRHAFDTSFRLRDLFHHPTLQNLGSATGRLYYWWATDAGPLGVQIFFGISGFIITHLLLKEERETGQTCLRCFYIRRVFRILPALTIFIACIALFSWAGFISVSMHDIGSAATFLCNTSAVTCGYYFGHLWSLSVEEQFYIFWPMIFLLGAGSRRAIAIYIALTLCVVWSVMPSLRTGGWLNNGLAFACISAGVCYALNTQFRSAFSSVRSLLPTRVWTLLLVIGLPLAESMLPALSPVWTVLTPFAIVVTVLGAVESSPARDARQWLVQIGLVSYSLYLWHAIATWDVERYYSHGFLLASVPIALLMTWISAKYLERYFVQTGRRLSRNTPHSALHTPRTPEVSQQVQ
jgi:peptidoglycan/LPS O-acetylase OafA/YrhL